MELNLNLNFENIFNVAKAIKKFFTSISSAKYYKRTSLIKNVLLFFRAIHQTKIPLIFKIISV